MRNELENFEGANTQILAIDPHESWSAKALLKRAGTSTDELNFPVLVDPSLTVSAMYGVAFQMRVHVEVSNRPATFIIDKSGVIRFAQRATTFSDRPSINDLLKELKKLE